MVIAEIRGAQGKLLQLQRDIDAAAHDPVTVIGGTLATKAAGLAERAGQELFGSAYAPTRQAAAAAYRQLNPTSDYRMFRAYAEQVLSGRYDARVRSVEGEEYRSLQKQGRLAEFSGDDVTVPHEREVGQARRDYLLLHELFERRYNRSRGIDHVRSEEEHAAIEVLTLDILKDLGAGASPIGRRAGAAYDDALRLYEAREDDMQKKLVLQKHPLKEAA